MKEYLYAIANEVTGMELVRSIYAKSLTDAEAKVKKLAYCFGKSTEVVGVELANQPDLPLKRKRLRA
jgi:hypothetical protein